MHNNSKPTTSHKENWELTILHCTDEDSVFIVYNNEDTWFIRYYREDVVCFYMIGMYAGEYNNKDNITRSVSLGIMKAEDKYKRNKVEGINYYNRLLKRCILEELKYTVLVQH